MPGRGRAAARSLVVMSAAARERRTCAELMLPTPTFPGKLGQIPILTLTGGTPASDPATRTVSLSGAALSLTAQTAATFNEAFAKPQGKVDIFQAGEILGALSFTAQTH